MGLVIMTIIAAIVQLAIPIGLIVGTVALCTWIVKRIWKGKEPKTKEE